MFFYLALQSYDTCYSYHRKDMTHGLLLGWLWMITTQMAGMTTAQKAWIVHSQDVGRSIYSTFKFCWTIVSIFLSLTVCLSDMKSLNTIVNFLKETSDCVLILKYVDFPTTWSCLEHWFPNKNRSVFQQLRFALPKKSRCQGVLLRITCQQIQVFFMSHPISSHLHLNFIQLFPMFSPCFP